MEQNDFNLISIVLFGSAVESVRTAQDYDILVVVKKLPSKEWLVAGEIKASLLAKLDKPLDLVFLEQKDLDFPSPFLYEVYLKHKLLYGEDVLFELGKVSDAVTVLVEGGVHVGWQIAQ